MEPFGFQWHLTDRCNMRCRHCYQERFDDRSEGSLDDARRMADRVLGAVAGRATQINLTGGEPLMLPWLEGLLRHLEGFDHVEEINVITNGTLADDEALRRLSASSRLRALKVSVESGDRQVNDRVRGRGNLARVESRLGALRRAGADLVLMVTLGRHNAGTIDATVRWARERRFAGIIFERFVPLGRGRAMAAQVLGGAGWALSVEAIVRAAGIEASSSELLPYRAFWLTLDAERDEPLAGAPCNLGDGSMALMPDGTVFPCRRLPLAQGNVLDEPFEEILARLSTWSPEAVAGRLRGEVCGTCGVEGCAGCRAMASALSGDPMADDPQCPLVSER